MSARSKVARFLMHGRGMGHDQAEQMLQDALDEHARELAEKIRSEVADMDGWPEEQHVARKYADLIDPDKEKS